jgi:hypothetical protein
LSERPPLAVGEGPIAQEQEEGAEYDRERKDDASDEAGQTFQHAFLRLTVVDGNVVV